MLVYLLQPFPPLVELVASMCAAELLAFHSISDVPPCVRFLILAMCERVILLKRIFKHLMANEKLTS